MEDIDTSLMTIIEGLVDARSNFFQADTLRELDWNVRGNVASRFMTNELLLLEVANRVYMTSNQTRHAATTLITLSVPTSFMNPVTVTATQTQIDAALEDNPNVTGNCSICQEAITHDGTRLRHCGHAHHRSCIDNWFTMSVRCPVCRHDIRDPVAQTSVVSSQTSSQSEDQSEEH